MAAVLPIDNRVLADADRQTSLRLYAVHAFERIDLRSLASRASGWVASSPATVRLADGSYAVCMRYGALVFVGSSSAVRGDFLSLLEALGNTRISGERESEELLLETDSERGDRYHGDRLFVRDTSLPRLQLVAEVLARSVVVASYEAVLREASNALEPLAKELAKNGRSRHSPRDLLRRIGSVLDIRQQLVGRAEVTEKPDILWDRPELERLFGQLMEEFEINERNAALAAKLTVINDTARTALDLVRHGSMLRVEWYIVWLIAFEIALSILYTLRSWF